MPWLAAIRGSRNPASFRGIPLSGQNRFHNGETRRSGEIADHMMQLNVHLIQGFRHVLNVYRSQLHETFPVAPKGTQSADALGWTVGSPEEAYGMEIL